MVDIHIHVIPDVDDGAENIEDSLSMLQTAQMQGVTSVIATPHNSAFDYGFEEVRREFARLQSAVQERQIPVRLGLGAEILCFESDMNMIIKLLGNGTYPTMNGTRYVLAEFFPNASKRAFFYCLRRLQQAGYLPIIAHAERYHNFDLESARELHAEGFLIQMNVYSVKQENYDRIRRRARSLLENRLVDFIGSDSHGMGHRPPAYTPGVDYMINHYDRAYLDSILEGNPASFLRA